MQSYGHTQPVQTGDTVTLVCEELAEGGDGLCRVRNYVVFVSGALPGETLEVRIVAAGRKNARGEIERIVTPSPDRTTPRCRHFGECGGCQLQHLAYAAQLREKTERLQRDLAFLLDREEVPVLPTIGLDVPWEHRSRVALQIMEQHGSLIGGLYRRRSRDVVQVEECPVSDPTSLSVALAGLDAARRSGAEAWNADNDAGTFRTLVARTNHAGETQLTLVARSRDRQEIDAFAREAASLPVAGLTLNLNANDRQRMFGRRTEVIRGSAFVWEEIAGVELRLSPGAYLRTSRAAAEAVVATVRRFVEPYPAARIVDLYTGNGLFALALAGDVAAVVGIDDYPPAIADAVASRERNGIENVRFETQKVEDFLRRRGKDDRPPHAVIVDPPAARGCGRFVLQELTRSLRPERIVYVASDPALLGQETRTLEFGGYRLSAVQPIDVAPHTTQVEAVALFETKIGGIGGRRQSSVSQARRLLARLAREKANAEQPRVPEEGDKR